jgi:phosphatidylglycerol:prolipoprotein diacylglycerol transferase
MYPYKLFGTDIDLYTVCLCLAVICAIIVFRVFSDKKKVEWKLQNFVVITAAVSICIGYFSAVFFQALYNIPENGGFVIDANTGATFYGGLIGGAACFLAIYFGIGALVFKKDGVHKKGFFTVADIAAASIASAHGFGRIGCFMVGCCHGGYTDAWYGVPVPNNELKMVPVQLYEAIFLFALFGFFVYRLLKDKSCNLPLYMSLYGCWRFFIEFFRRDDRGSTVVDFLSPSQFIAILMIIGSVGLFFGQKYIMKKQLASAEKTITEVEESTDEK